MCEPNLEKSHLDIYRFHIMVALTVFAAFILNVWGIWHADHSDEYNEVFEALRVCSGYLNFERWSKKFYLYILSLGYAAYYAVGWLSNAYDSPVDFATKIVRNLDPLFLIGRSISAIFGAASVLMTYLIGKSLFNARVGLIASLFLCLSVTNIELAHYARVDATLCLLVLIAFYFIARILLDKRSPAKYYVLAGLFSGIAFQTKPPAIILVFPFIVSQLLRLEGKGGFHNILCKEVAYYCIFFIIGLMVGNPAIIVAPDNFLANLLRMRRVYTTPINETVNKYIGFVAYMIHFYREMGFFLSLLTIYAVVKGIVSKEKRSILILSFVFPFFILMGASRYMVSGSYMIPIMPFLYILTFKYLVELIYNRKYPPSLSKALLLISLFVLIIHPVVNVINFERSLLGKNTRILAGEWIEKNVPFGSKILMDSGKSINSFAPKIDENRESILRTLSAKSEALANNELFDPSRMVDQNALIYYKLLLKTVPEASYDITSTMFGLDVKSIDYYVSRGYEYFIISKQMKDSRTAPFFLERYPEIGKFYGSLDNDDDLKLLQVINPSNTNMGDTFYVYKILDK